MHQADRYCPRCGADQSAPADQRSARDASQPDTIMEPPDIVKQVLLAIATIVALFLAYVALTVLVDIGSGSALLLPAYSSSAFGHHFS